MSIANCRCSHPAAQADSLYRWPPGTTVTWCLAPTSALPAGYTHEHAEETIGAGIAPWAAVCSAQIEHTADPTSARVLVVFGPLAAADPSLVELGLTDLPVGQAQSLMRLNVDTAWTDQELAQVSLHEFGHALGLVHTAADVKAVMNPIYQDDIDGPMPPDVAQALLRYPLHPQVDEDSLPAIVLGSQVQVDATFEAKGVFPIGLTVAGHTPALFDVVVPGPGDYRLTIDFERAPS